MKGLLSTLPLRPSAQVTEAGTTTGSGEVLREPFHSLAVIFDLSAVGDDTQEADTLDVYVDAGVTVGESDIWVNIGRFTQIVGVDAVKASATVTLTGVIVPGSHAESVVTASTILDGDTLTLGERTYRFKDTIAQIDDIAIGAGDAAALDNLKHIINGTGTPGTHYFTGSTANADVVATDNDDTTQKVVARAPGTAANALATTSSGATLSWADTTLGGGTGDSNPGVASETVTVASKTYSFVDVLSETNGAAAIVNQILFGADSAAALDNLKSAVNGTAGEATTYSTGTVAHTLIDATDNADTTQKFEAKTTGAGGNAYNSTETLSNGGFAGVTFSGGTAGPGITDRQTLAWSNDNLESSQPVNSDADLSSAGVRKIGLLTKLRYRGVATGDAPDFTYSVTAVAK